MVINPHDKNGEPEPLGRGRGENRTPDAPIRAHDMAQSECVLTQKAGVLPERRRDAVMEVRHCTHG